MTYECIALDSEERTDWNDYVAASPQATPFHRFESLQVFARESGTTLHPLLVKKGAEPIGLFPVFERRVGPVRVAFSPPPALKVEYLGPVLVERQELTRRRRERNLSHVVETALDWVDEHVGPRYIHARTGPRFDDPRPFEWRGWTVEPRHTYVVDLTVETATLFDAFSSDARSNVRDAEEYDVNISPGGPEAIDPIVDLIVDRHEQQGIDYPLEADTIHALYDALPDGVVRPYLCEFRGSVVGGQLSLELGDTHLVWLGTGLRDIPIAPNDLMDWYVMQDSKSRGIERYDFLGANNERIADYKAKFAPEIERYYRLERGSLPTRLAAQTFRRVT